MEEDSLEGIAFSPFEVLSEESESSVDNVSRASSKRVATTARRRSISSAFGLDRRSSSFSTAASNAVSEVIRSGMTKVSVRMMEQHRIHSLAELCKELADGVYVPVSALRHVKYLGEGAFAGRDTLSCIISARN